MIRTGILVSSVIVLAATSQTAMSQDWDCTNAGDLPQQGMNYCAAQDFKKADAALNAAWSLIRKDAIQASDGSDPLLAGQRAWLEYRDQQCDAESLIFEGGSLQPLIISSCRAHMSRDRTEELLLMERYN